MEINVEIPGTTNYNEEGTNLVVESYSDTVIVVDGIRVDVEDLKKAIRIVTGNHDLPKDPIILGTGYISFGGTEVKPPKSGEWLSNAANQKMHGKQL
jgi:hypothetical protein